MPTINSLAKRYFWIFIWHSSRDTRQLRGWLRLNSLFNNPGYKYLFFKWRIVKSKLKYKIQISPKPTSVILKHTYTHTTQQQAIKICDVSFQLSLSEKTSPYLQTTMCPCLSSASQVFVFSTYLFRHKRYIIAWVWIDTNMSY